MADDCIAGENIPGLLQHPNYAELVRHVAWLTAQRGPLNSLCSPTRKSISTTASPKTAIGVQAVPAEDAHESAAERRYYMQAALNGRLQEVGLVLLLSRAR